MKAKTELDCIFHSDLCFDREQKVGRILAKTISANIFLTFLLATIAIFCMHLIFGSSPPNGLSSFCKVIIPLGIITYGISAIMVYHKMTGSLLKILLNIYMICAACYLYEISGNFSLLFFAPTAVVFGILYLINKINYKATIKTNVVALIIMGILGPLVIWLITPEVFEVSLYVVLHIFMSAVFILPISEDSKNDNCIKYDLISILSGSFLVFYPILVFGSFIMGAIIFLGSIFI